MDIAEKRRPQDGRIKISDDGKEIEIRISSMPVAFAEKLVLRIFDPEILLQNFGELGFDPSEMNKFLKYIDKPHGIILVTGPTGSGKTTTLYSCLKKLASSEKNIVTIEDPPELIFEAINQVAVKPIIGLTFAAALRTILRQDPDVIMVGEIRDAETAENAIQAALTGHLVLSTLHTNDAPSSITRLIDMGIPPFLISSTILCVLAQRLMRKICPRCKTKYQATDEDFAKLKIKKPEKPFYFHKGTGCSFCRKTGYYSREAIFEMMEVSPTIKDLITVNTHEDEIRKTAMKEGLIPLRDAALKKLSMGISTTDEMQRVMGTI
jgi:general secretion pathway protein E